MRVVNLNKEPYEIYVGRGSKWGNPYTHISDKETLAKYVVGSREEAMLKYREYLESNEDLLNSLHELEGKVLGCFCMPNDGTFPIPYICHGQILIEHLTIKKLQRFFVNK